MSARIRVWWGEALGEQISAPDCMYVPAIALIVIDCGLHLSVHLCEYRRAVLLHVHRYCWEMS